MSLIKNKESIINTKYVPIVLHKIVGESPKVWEDISFERWQKILEYTLTTMDFSKRLPIEVTFDDGNNSDYEIAFPGLLENALKAKFFIITDNVGKSGYLNWNQIIEMHKYGMKFGSHSKSHVDLTAISHNEALIELDISKKIIEDKLGTEVDFFSFPYGFSNSKLISSALSLNYKKIYTSKHGIANDKKRVIPRNSINAKMNNNDLLKALNPSLKTKIFWQVEDISKSILKKGLTARNYKKIRDIVSGN